MVCGGLQTHYAFSTFLLCCISTDNCDAFSSSADHFGLTTELVHTLVITASTAWWSLFIRFCWVIPPAEQKSNPLLALSLENNLNTWFHYIARIICHCNLLSGKNNFMQKKKKDHYHYLKFLLDQTKSFTDMGRLLG